MMKYISRVICILLLLTSVMLLLLPCWTEEDTSVSAAEYILHPADHKMLTRQLRDVTDERDLSTRNALPIFVLLAVSAAGAVFSLLKINTDIPCICAVLAGAVGVFTYLTNAALKVGAIAPSGLTVSAVMLLLGAAILIISRVTKKGE